MPLNALPVVMHVLKSYTIYDWIVQCFTSPPTQYRLYGRRFLQVKTPNQQYQSTEGESTKENTNKSKNKIRREIRNSTR